MFLNEPLGQWEAMIPAVAAAAGGAKGGGGAGAGVGGGAAPPAGPYTETRTQVSPVTQVQVSPQISPVFQQAFQPQDSPMTAGTQQVTRAPQAATIPGMNGERAYDYPSEHYAGDPYGGGPLPDRGEGFLPGVFSSADQTATYVKWGVIALLGVGALAIGSRFLRKRST